MKKFCGTPKNSAICISFAESGMGKDALYDIDGSYLKVLGGLGSSLHSFEKRVEKSAVERK